MGVTSNYCAISSFFILDFNHSFFGLSNADILNIILLQIEKERAEKFAAKEDKKKVKDELNTLFKPVEQKIAKGWCHSKATLFFTSAIHC